MDDIQADLDAYLADEADEAAIARLEQWLLADPEHRREFVRASRLRTALRAEIAAHVERTSAGLSRPHLRAEGTIRPGRWIWPSLLAVAAMVVLGVGAWWLAMGGEPARRVPPPADIAWAGPGAALHGVRPVGVLTAGTPVDLGDQVTGPCRIALRDGSLLDLAAAATMELQPATSGTRVALHAGRVEATVAHQAAGRTFVVATAQAEVTVVGTQFTVASQAGSTNVAVSAGVVRVASRAGGDPQVLTAGQRASVAEGLATSRILSVAATGTTVDGALGSLAEAIARARPGDEIVLLPGRHTVRPAGHVEVHTRIRASGTPGRPIIIRGEPGRPRPVLASSSWNALLIEDSAYIELRGIDVVAGSPMADVTAGNGIYLKRCHHIQIEDCTISDFGGDGLAITDSDRILVAGSRITGCGRTSKWGQGGISISNCVPVDDRPGPRIRIIGNRITGCRNLIENISGTTFDGWSGGNAIAIYKYRPADPTLGGTHIADSILYGNDGAGVHIYQSDAITVQDCILHWNGQGQGGRAEINVITDGGCRFTSVIVLPGPNGRAISHGKDAKITHERTVRWGGGAFPAPFPLAAGNPLVPVADEPQRQDFTRTADFR
jgi:parallel beta-helix repeat protein